MMPKVLNAESVLVFNDLWKRCEGLRRIPQKVPPANAGGSDKGVYAARSAGKDSNAGQSSTWLDELSEA